MEKAGVNISFVESANLPASATLNRPHCQGAPFRVEGLSMIFHPRTPYAPTAHLNIRRFEVLTSSGPVVWFGGGFDITPYIMDCGVAQLFHQKIESFLRPHGQHLYKEWSENCDRYFFLPHRNEPRGIGGIFFDDYLSDKGDQATADFLVEQVTFFYQFYRQLLAASTGRPYSERERDFQLWRRGRYAEFNLLYDRGTRFGLESGGRTESILISLPPQTYWGYHSEEVFQKEQGQWEHLIQSVQQVKTLLKQGRLQKDEVF